MKKILLFGGLLLVIIGLHAHGACLLKNIEMETSCTGAAADIKKSQDNKDLNTDYKMLEESYKIPSISIPNSNHNGFPIINQNQGCLYGICNPWR